jgi:membrane protein YdbS with pleckstrin-like domain
MHCTNCGSYIAQGTRFCAGCGAPSIDPEMTRLAGARPGELLRGEEPTDIERTIFTARPTMLFIKIGYVAAALGAVLLTVILALFSFVDIPWYISLPLALGLLLIPAYYHLKRNMVSYTLTDSKVMIDQGLIARTTRNIPLRNIQDVTVSATIPQRLLGFGNLIIDNASEQGGTTILRNINDPRHHADLLLRELRRWR